MLRSSRWVVAALCAAVHASAVTAHAQWQSNTGPSGAALGAVVGGDVERYVRALLLAGVVRPVSWGARTLGPSDLIELIGDDSAKAHPWRSAMRSALAEHATLGGQIFASANSGFAWGSNDGALWQGRGVNIAIGGAATFHTSRISAVFAPVAFVAQNASFPTLLPPVASAPPYADALFPTLVDLPQRMGTRNYTRIDPGESTVRVRGLGLETGVSTASEGWGAGEAFPAIFGANAGGFPHLFVGTTRRGVRVPFVGRVSGRYILGTLQQSAFSTVQGSETYIDRNEPGTTRIGVGLNVSFMPDLLPGLELGASRFYHSPYENGPRRWDAWSKPFEGIFKKGFKGRSGGPEDIGGDVDNQLASFFARWAFPKRGVEATLEVFREDHNWDSRDFAQEPENNSAVLASFRATTERSASRLAVLTFEYFDGDIRPIGQVRAQGYLYSHGYLRQGHTQRGQLLGSPIGVGAIAGERVAWERFTPTGSMRFNFQRWRTRSVFTTNPEALFLAAETQIPNDHDWILDASVAATRYRKRGAVTVEGGIAWAGLFNFSDSRTNLYSRVSLGVF